MFDLYANKNQLIVREREPVTSGSVNAYSVRFEFSEDWDGLEKIVIFQAGCVDKAVLLSGQACVVPSEPLAAPGYYLMAGVYGKTGDALVLPTVWANLGLIQEGAVPKGGEPPDVPDPGGTTDHRQLSYRDAAGQHPIESITGLAKELERIPEPAEALTNFELEELLK